MQYNPGQNEDLQGGTETYATPARFMNSSPTQSFESTNSSTSLPVNNAEYNDSSYPENPNKKQNNTKPHFGFHGFTEQQYIIDITTICVSAGGLGDELMQILAISIYPDDLISASIFRNKLCYHHFRIDLMDNDVEASFTELRCRDPVSFRLIKCLWRDDYLRLTTQWTNTEKLYGEGKGSYPHQ